MLYTKEERTGGEMATIYSITATYHNYEALKHSNFFQYAQTMPPTADYIEEDLI